MFVVSKGVSFTLGPNELLESLFTSPRLEEKEHHWLWTCSMTLGEFNMWVFSLKWWVFPNNFHGVFPIKNWCFWGGDWGKPTIFGYIHVNFQSRRESQTSNWFLHHSQWTFALRIAGIFGPGDFSSMSFVTKIEDLPPPRYNYKISSCRSSFNPAFTWSTARAFRKQQLVQWPALQPWVACCIERDCTTQFYRTGNITSHEHPWSL